jgi:NADH:ubiquinone oxidoreductase subunit 4 (subunit M)
MEMVPLFVLAAAIIVVGIYPAVISDVFSKGLEPIVQMMQEPARLAFR